MSNHVVRWEFWSRQPDEVSEFYRIAFDWKIQHIPAMDYRVFESGEGGTGGGIFGSEDGPIPGNMALFADPEGRVNGLWQPLAGGGGNEA
jgi:predicted enzyme related to lactoylglutathione lyase